MAYCGSPGTCARRSAWDQLNSHLGLGLSDSTLTTYASVDTAAAGQAVGNYVVWVDTPPNGAGSKYPGSLGGATDVLFVRVERFQTSFFGHVVGYQGTTVSAWSSAGTFPSRFAVVTLRRGTGNNGIDAGPANTTDIKLAGNNSTLTVIDGDVGGNWGMKLTASSTLKMAFSSGGTQPSIWLKDYLSCGNSCWSNSQVLASNGTSLSTTYPPNGARKLGGFIPDPNYLPPTGLGSMAPAAAVPASGIPTGDNSGSINITRGVVSATGTCTASVGDPAPPKIGPGWYSDITIGNGNCVVLDPLFRHSTPNVPSTDVATPVAQTQQPGIFYLTGVLNIGQNALMAGDGVTLVIRPTSNGPSQFSPNAGGAADLNRGLVSGGSGQILGAWTTKGQSSYVFDAPSLRWVYQASRESNPKTYGRGIAFYVLKPSQYLASPAVDANTNVIGVTSGAAISWNGVTYAPHDNAQIAGQPFHAGVGQLISWTFTFNGGTDVTQTYSGPDEGFPILLEPCTSGNDGAC
jgi:hypothetical protein